MTARAIRCVLVLTAALSLVGCASNQQFVRIPDLNKRVEDPTKARVYVIRPSSMGSSASLEVWDGKVHVGNTGPTAYLCWEREPGPAEISGREENISTVPLTVQSNQAYYIFQHMRIGWVQARNKLEIIPEEEGQKLLRKCAPPKAGKCKDHPECAGK
jgi:hypothetical protein